MGVCRNAALTLKSSHDGKAGNAIERGWALGFPWVPEQGHPYFSPPLETDSLNRNPSFLSETGPSVFNCPSLGNHLLWKHSAVMLRPERDIFRLLAAPVEVSVSCPDLCGSLCFLLAPVLPLIAW